LKHNCKNVHLWAVVKVFVVKPLQIFIKVKVRIAFILLEIFWLKQL